MVGQKLGVQVLGTVILYVVLCGEAVTSCCVPQQWEAYVRILQGDFLPGNRGEVEGTDLISYDFTNKRTFNNVTTVSGRRTTRTIYIEDFKKGIRYDIVNNTCTTRNLTGSITNCLPGNANFTGTTYFGAGNNKLEINTYSLIIGNAPLLITTTKEDCILLSQTMAREEVSNATANELVFTTFMGMTLGIKDPKVFDPPSLCFHSDEPPVAGPLLRPFGDIGKGVW